MSMFPISEIFSSLQGEGVNIGKPSIFVRFGTCNLSCGWSRVNGAWEKNGGWQCDAYYSWMDAKDFKLMEVFEVVSRIKELGLGLKIKHLIFTGGEPLLQQNRIRQILYALEVSMRLTDYDHVKVEVETNGTILPEQSTWSRIKYWDISPKLSNSGMPEERRIVPNVIKFFRSFKDAYFKFVISSAEDVLEMQRTFVIPFDLSPNRIILMPEGTDVQTLNERGVWLSKICLDNGYLFSPRLQIWLYGNKRGT